MRKISTLTTRRSFLRRSAAGLAGLQFLPGSVLGLNGAPSPNNKLNLACIGVAGRGQDNIEGVKSENIVALCDVDEPYASATFAKYPGAKRFTDYRRMFDEMEKEIDAVVISTPDHTHAVIALRALKAGKDVYCEKPLAHSIEEVRTLMAAAREHKAITQLGNQGHSSDSIRQFCEAVWSGVIGQVREVHAFCQSNYSRIGDLDAVKQTEPVPAGVDWDLWLGPVPARPFRSNYIHGKWRGWSQFGTGVVGDWTCHVVDPVFWALGLGAPSSFVAAADGYDPRRHSETFPPGSRIRYDFPAAVERGAVQLFWYDGAQRPARPPELEPGEELPGIGALVVGDRGKIVYGSHGAGGLKLIPQSRNKEYQNARPPQSLPRSPGHYKEWVQACKDRKPAGSSFDYGGPLTELALLGIIALRMKGTKLRWDSEHMTFLSSKTANQFIKAKYRAGWSL